MRLIELLALIHKDDIVTVIPQSPYNAYTEPPYSKALDVYRNSIVRQIRRDSLGIGVWVEHTERTD